MVSYNYFILLLSGYNFQNYPSLALAIIATNQSLKRAKYFQQDLI